MSQQLITYGSDRRLVLSNGEAIRAPIFLGTWTKLRIGLRFALTGGVGLSGSPEMAFGVCAGNTNGFGSATPGHVVGAHRVSSAWTYNAGPTAYYSQSEWFSFVKKVGATVTNVVGNTGTDYCSGDSTVRNVWLLEITKGSPNFSFLTNSINTAAAAQSDVTDTQFDQIMEMGTFDTASISAIKASYSAGFARTLAVSETTDGTLDHLFVYWPRTTVLFGFDIKFRRVS